MYSCDKLFSAFTPWNRENINIYKKRDYATSAQSLCGGKSQCGVTCCIILIIAALCSDDIEVSPGAECTELRALPGERLLLGGQMLLLVLGMCLQELFAEWEQHWAPSCLSCVCQHLGESLAEPTRRHARTKSQSNLCLLVKTECSRGSNKWFDLCWHFKASAVGDGSDLGERQGVGVGHEHQGGASGATGGWPGPHRSFLPGGEMSCELWSKVFMSPSTALWPLLFSRWW